jgi:dipeptidyl aminopeptidase/acylaminoacyl peptidase
MEPTWTPDRIIHYPLIEHVHLSPNGRRVLYTVRTPYLTETASEFRQQIWLAYTDGETQTMRLTFGESASQPRWSPDGGQIAFLRKMPESKHAGLWVMQGSGGEAWPLTAPSNGIHHAITNFCWSPDGKQIAFLCVPHDAERSRRQQGRDDAHHWRVDYDFAHLFVVDVAPAGALPPVRQLTAGNFHVLNLAWSPDGARIAFTHRPTPLLESWPQSRLATIASDGSEAELTDLGLATNWAGALVYSPDGQWIATDLTTEGEAWAYASRMMLYPAQGGEPIPLASVSDEQPNVVGWTLDGSAVYVLNQHGLSSQLIALPVDGGPPQVVIDGDAQFSLIHVNGIGQAALVMQDFDEPNSVYIADLATNGAPQKVAEPSTAEYPAGPLPQVRTLRWQTDDGLTVEGILYLPAHYNEESGERLPLLLHIHGGPMGVFQRQYSGTPYYYTPAALCERGIAVLRCNPRGSGGYGKAFRFANRHDWGGGDYRDLQQGVDTVIELGIADPERLGICGWSYGGFMTSWTITQTDRFRAASIGAAVTNAMSFNATADIPSFIPDYFGCEYWQDPSFYQAHSPIFHAHKVVTPSLIQHGDADPRVPLEQGLQFFYALKRRGVPVEMYIYPRQGHAINEPRLLADALRRNLEWFTEMLVEG